MPPLEPSISVELRPVRPDDAPGLKNLLYASMSDDEVAEQIAKAIRAQREGKELCLVALADGAVVATAMLISRTGSVGHVVNVAIDEAFRGCGLFGRLLAEFKTVAGPLKLKRLRISAEPENVAALKAYRKVGFCEIARSDGLVRFEMPVGR